MGKHAFVDEFLKGENVRATVFSSSLGSLKDLPIPNVLYTYDTLDGTTILLERNNTIYMGDMMEGSLANPLQSEENGIHIFIHTKNSFPDDSGSQNIPLPDGTLIPILYCGVPPYIPV